VKRIASSLLALACAAMVGGCDLGPDFSDACIIGPCGTGGNAYELYAIGFPYGRVDRSTTTADGGYVGRLAVGDTFTLHLVVGRGPTSVDGDTVAVASWAVTDPAVAGISRRPSGAGFFTAKAAGTVRVSADGRPAQMWACEGQGCSRVGEIVVTR
jgi:hypothetical protein